MLLKKELHNILFNEEKIITPVLRIMLKHHPNLYYFETMKDWQEFVIHTPEDYEEWIIGGAQKAAEFKVA